METLRSLLSDSGNLWLALGALCSGTTAACLAYFALEKEQKKLNLLSDQYYALSKEKSTQDSLYAKSRRDCEELEKKNKEHEETILKIKKLLDPPMKVELQRIFP